MTDKEPPEAPPHNPDWDTNEHRLMPDNIPTEEFLRIKEDSMTDVLTGLPNERYFKQELERFQEYKGTGAVLMMDLHNLKEVNNSMGGHKAGDFLLKKFASLLKLNIRADDFCARLHGDEFAVILRGITKAILQERLQQLSSVFPGGRDRQHHLIPTVAIGAVHTDDIENEVSYTMQCADYALYQAKNISNKEEKIADTIGTGKTTLLRKPTSNYLYDRNKDGVPTGISQKILEITSHVT